MKFSDAIAQFTADNCLATDLSSNPEISGVADIRTAAPDTLSYVESSKYADWIERTPASALILPDDARMQARASARAIAWVACHNPRLTFAQAISLFYQPYRPAPGIHPTAVIDPTVKLGADVSIGAHAVLGARTVLGDRTCVHPNVTIYPDVTIGDRVTLHANCTINERTWIGDDCIIHSGAAIGGEGFGFVPSAKGWIKMEQSGRVVLETGVEVGSNSAIDRPAVGETRIGQNTKIDNLVQIGHGCHIGANCAIAGQTGLAGGVRVGNGVLLAGQVGISNQIEVGDGAIVTAKSGVQKSVVAGATVSGYPAISHQLHLQAAAIHKKLPEIYQFVRKLQAVWGSDRASD
ncbi:UDP-3-O-[3-hydroxymyristoyl] glucosamine N-acyltransferase [Rubidibacter lacunae KORDI 51-2]|uniref:UDP-3-O-acylglucosamine N-acyltransferase n=1 Tax=Rubidibacter lacunae KORDI 51-2 TaxID=582515 RepID=U5DN98_9CHRO|nr:UDP-3-O-(3-hydroxymyristoyl)glucosamine N-acyltransferase [Rubidibacter lacunae]ERN41165.1 UDP-3-O-[3-hydroxymyristoyl] glucosamine N-acyltransferase [Rubidibacter lacunae KORDI 51-2]